MKYKIIIIFILALFNLSCSSVDGNNLDIKNPPVISMFQAVPQIIATGQSSQLSWSVTGASVVELSGFGQVGQIDSRTVTPLNTTTYVLNATNADGTTTESVIVSMNQKAEIISLEESKQLKYGFCFLITTFKNIGSGIGRNFKITAMLYDSFGDPLDSAYNSYFEDIAPGMTIQLEFTFFTSSSWNKIARVGYAIIYDTVSGIPSR
jgi:hypothetical protein